MTTNNMYNNNNNPCAAGVQVSPRLTPKGPAAGRSLQSERHADLNGWPPLGELAKDGQGRDRRSWRGVEYGLHDLTSPSPEDTK